MIAFDADVLTLIFQGEPECVRRAALVPPAEHRIPIIVVEEILRGRFNTIRQAQGGRSGCSLAVAYSLLQRTLDDLRLLPVLPYTIDADQLVGEWRKQKIRVGISDMRIAAICVAQSVTLISRNRQDFGQIPGLNVEFW